MWTRKEYIIIKKKEGEKEIENDSENKITKEELKQIKCNSPDSFGIEKVKRQIYVTLWELSPLNTFYSFPENLGIRK